MNSSRIGLLCICRDFKELHDELREPTLGQLMESVADAGYKLQVVVLSEVKACERVPGFAHDLSAR